MQQLQWLSGCMKDKRKWFWLAMALAVVSAGLCVVFPFITQQITDRVLVGQTLPDGSVQRQTQLLVPLVCVMIGAQLLRSCVRYGMTRLWSMCPRTSSRTSAAICTTTCAPRTRALYAVPHGRPDDAPDGRSGHGAPHSVLDLVQRGGEHLPVSVFHDISVQRERRADAPSAGRCPVILACSFLFSRTVYPLYASLREKLSRMNSVAQENIAGNKTVRAFVREAYENEKFENCNEEYRQANLKANFHWLKFFPYIEAAPSLWGFCLCSSAGCSSSRENDGRRPRRLFADVLGPVGADARAGHLPERFSAVPHLRRKGH